MFDIKIGTLIPAVKAVNMIPSLNEMGFESYTLDFNGTLLADRSMVIEHSKAVNDLIGSSVVSACGCYGNPITDEAFRENLKHMIKSAHLYGCSVVGTFAGGDSSKSVPDNIPEFKRIFSELCKIAEDSGVKIAIENCGSGWEKGTGNIGFCPRSWEMMFDAVQSPALALEWEPAHAQRQLIDPIPQIRKWAPKVAHIHGKDSTVAWDVIKANGIGCGLNYVWDRLPGFGDSNWSDIFTILLQAGFKGACDIEGYHDPVYSGPMEWTSQLVSLEYLKKCRGGVTYITMP